MFFEFCQRVYGWGSGGVKIFHVSVFDVNGFLRLSFVLGFERFEESFLLIGLVLLVDVPLELENLNDLSIELWVFSEFDEVFILIFRNTKEVNCFFHASLFTKELNLIFSGELKKI